MDARAILTFLGGMALSGIVLGVIYTWPVERTCAEKRVQFEAYRYCMQTAGKSGCKMSVPDFQDYHTLKRELERCDDRSEH